MQANICSSRAVILLLHTRDKAQLSAKWKHFYVFIFSSVGFMSLMFLSIPLEDSHILHLHGPLYFWFLFLFCRYVGIL